MTPQRITSGLLTNKLKTAFPFIFVVLLAGSIGIYLRLYPLAHHIPFETNERATIFVLSNIRKSVIDNINKAYPNLPVSKKNDLIKRSIDNILKTQGTNIQKAIATASADVGGAPSELTSGPYLQESDGYYYYGLTQTIAETGRISDEIKGSKYFNKLMLSPVGFWQPLNLHPYIGYWTYRILKVFNPHIDLMFAVSFTPLLLMIIILTLFVFLCYLLGCRPLPTLVGSVLFLCASIYLKRSTFGWYDDDSYNILFPLLIIIAVLTGLKHCKQTRPRILWAGLAALSFTLYALFWHGWMFLLTTICAGGGLCALYILFILKQKKEALSLTQFFAMILIGTLLGITAIFGLSDFFTLFQEGWKALREFSSPQMALWPDLYIGVGELEKPAFGYWIDLLGGAIYIFLGIFGFIYYGIHLFKKKNQILIERFFILSLILMVTLYLSYGAIRFALLAVIPVGIFCVIGLNILFNKIQGSITARFKDKQFSQLFSLVLILFISFTVILTSSTLAYRKVPLLMNKIFNSTWEHALVKINRGTPKESVVNTWWPPGHFIKAIAQRRVIFDGSTINKPQGYWLANLFINDDEKQAVGILRMLNDSANQAAEYLQDNGIQLSQAVRILKEIAPVSTEKARQILTPLLPQAKIDDLLKLTHAAPPPVYLLIYNDMIEKSMEFKFVGGWNFEKVEALTNNQDVLKNLPPKNSVAYIRSLWNIAGGAYRFSDILGQLSQAGDILTFEQNVKIDLSSKDCFVNSPRYGKGIPQSIFYIENGHLVEKTLQNPSLPYSVILSQVDSLYECVLLDRPLARSFIMRLYFLKGADLKYLKLFTKEEDLTRRTRIYVYEIDWDRFNADLQKDQ